jgi:GNAT superfamily N-acetyltransferase
MREGLRAAQTGDLEAVAAIWSVGWHDGHDGHTPEELTRARTEASFRARAAARLGDTTLAEVDGTIAGFVVVRADEVEQIYVATEHRGTGPAVRLLRAAADIVAEGGHRRARRPSRPVTPGPGASTSVRAGSTRVLSTTPPKARTAPLPSIATATPIVSGTDRSGAAVAHGGAHYGRRTNSFDMA